MKKTLFRMAGLLVALAVILAASRLWAESKEKKTSPRTRVGLFNLTYVIKNSDKYKEFQEEIKEVVEPFQKRDAKLRVQLEKLRVQAEQSKKDESTIIRTKMEDLEEKAKKVQREMEDLEEKAKKVQREMEDNAAKAKKILGKRSDEEMKILFTDVEDTVKRYAAAHDLDLVMHYSDAVTHENYLSAPNIARKLNTAALLPIYTDTGIDISKDIVKMMNQRARNQRDEE